jgi:DNA repair exonuclease SbcCD ATPase subunit
VDEQAIELLRQQIRAEEATAAAIRERNELAARTLRQAETSERIRRQFWADISEKTAGLVGKLPELEYLLHGLVEKLDEVGDRFRETEKRLDRIEYGLMLLLDGKRNGNRAKAQALVEDIGRDKAQRELLGRRYRVLEELQMQLATYGVNRPPEIVLQVEDLQAEIDRLEREMDES